MYLHAGSWQKHLSALEYNWGCWSLYEHQEKEESVFLATWYQGLETLNDDADMNEAYWQKLMAVKTAVNKELEAKRSEGVIGGSLQAEVTLYCDSDLAALLSKLDTELRFALITSTAEVKPLSESSAAAETEVDGAPAILFGTA